MKFNTHARRKIDGLIVLFCRLEFNLLRRANRGFVQTMAQAAPNSAGVEVYGPADAPLGLIRGRRRKRFLVRADRAVDLSAYMATWRARVRPPAAVRVAIDIDPYSFL